MERIAQLSFEDVAKYEIVKKEPRRFAFIDEAGSFGFDFDKSFYIVCAVIVNEDHIPEIGRKVEEIRKYRFGGGEMKSKNIGNNHTKRTTVFADLLAMDFSILLSVIMVHRNNLELHDTNLAQQLKCHDFWVMKLLKYRSLYMLYLIPT